MAPTARSCSPPPRIISRQAGTRSSTRGMAATRTAAALRVRSRPAKAMIGTPEWTGAPAWPAAPNRPEGCGGSETPLGITTTSAAP